MASCRQDDFRVVLPWRTKPFDSLKALALYPDLHQRVENGK